MIITTMVIIIVIVIVIVMDTMIVTVTAAVVSTTVANTAVPVMVTVVVMRFSVTVIDVFFYGPGPEHQVPDQHENGSVQGHVVDHERGHDHHFEVGQNDRREAQRDQLRYQHVRAHHHVLDVSAAFGRYGRIGGRSDGGGGGRRIGLYSIRADGRVQREHQRHYQYRGYDPSFHRMPGTVSTNETTTTGWRP